MEEVKERFLDFRDWVVDRFYDIKDFLADNPNVKRWLVEGCIAIAVGILAGVITFNVLNHEKKSLAVSEENAAHPAQEQSADGSEDISAGASMDETDYGDVVIEVVDPGVYVGDIANWSEEEIAAAVSERSHYLDETTYWPAVESYWQTRGVSGNARFCTYLFDTTSKVYSASDFEGVPKDVIHIIKNEMYARHGYSFRDSNLMNYFMGQVWYSPSIMPADFSEKTFTETEVKNLDLLNSIDQ
ncbi:MULTISPECIES: YARHG domain-containing protein [Pseudobutyrivibrio]|uniref:YARHG domain-containing protein n=1 Tax=Pseudobutyrivibrio xylanivorans TaxID=185007 RepID=A0A1G5RQZ1_PSEXY|nr:MULTISPECIES: YARHG domain-containing protein [Pseudobutyrivibrio]MDC7280263.1 YARHG domain-containing protein [Butyrivibrio fibrisolvens]SCZ76416.1 YARHG domain-containing protein [Pseudobutyrivibrio xylanivorans]